MESNCTVIIPARKGSKGIPGKNMIFLGNKRLIEWTIDLALKLDFVSKIIVSTDCPNIAELANSKGPIFHGFRKGELAEDNSSMNDVILYEIDKHNLDGNFILLQPTSPLRTIELLNDAYNLFSKFQPDSLVSVVKKPKGVYWTFNKDPETGYLKGLFENIPTRRQDMQECYELNGSIYISSVKNFIEKKTFFSEKSLGFTMSEQLSIDIDTLSDLKRVKEIIEKWKGKE